VIEYDPKHWRSHFFDIRGSMVREIGYRVLTVGITGIVVSVLDGIFHIPIAVSSVAHGIVGPALFLLLVFRTNTANDRYWEGRKIWGGIVNTVRNLRRKSSRYLTNEETTQVVEWLVAYMWSLRYHLISTRQFGPDSKLSAEDQAALLAAPHLPVYCGDRLSTILQAARARGAINDHQWQQFDLDVQALIDHAGASERINNTPLPYAYAVHLRRALALYVFTLPFALVSTFHLWTFLVSLGISYVLLGIDEIGAEIEGPFGTDPNDLPLEDLCKRIGNHLRDSAANQATTTASAPP